MCISFLSFKYCSSSDKADKQQAAQDKLDETRNNLGTFSVIPLQKEIADYTQPKTVSKAQIATAAATERMFEDVDAALKEGITIAPYRTIDKPIDAHHIEDSFDDSISENVAIIHDQISPTCFRGLEEKDSTNLENIYVATTNTKFIAGRTGIIDTPKKARHFDAIVRDQLDQFPQKNEIARVVSHQLNSPEAESKMIENQHREMAILNVENKKYKVAHLNTPSNVLYDYTLYIRKIPLIGCFLSTLIEGIFLYGERVSKEQNLEGLARMALWLKEDNDKVFYFDKPGLNIPGIEVLINQMNNLIDQIDDAVSTNATEDLLEHRSSMSTYLLSYYDKLENLDQQLQKYIDRGQGATFKPVQEKVALMRMILGDQLDIEGQALDRGCLNMAIE